MELPADLKSKWGFKPYYNWNTFNTFMSSLYSAQTFAVLNLIITGIPSIPTDKQGKLELYQSFKPYYNWNTFNTLDLNKNIDFMVDWFTF